MLGSNCTRLTRAGSKITMTNKEQLEGFCPKLDDMKVHLKWTLVIHLCIFTTDIRF